MLEEITIRGFKSLRDVTVPLKSLSVFFGPNAAGKSNLLDAVQFLGAAVSERSLSDALKVSRGFPIEAFRFPEGGLPALLNSPSAEFDIAARIRAPVSSAESQVLRYELGVALTPKTGAVSTRLERLEKLHPTTLNCQGQPRIETDLPRGKILIRRREKQGHPREEDVGQNHTIASVPAYTGREYPEIDALRHEMGAWRVYYLEPRVEMRKATPPQEVRDVGVTGQDLPAFLYAIKNRPETRATFDAIRRLVRQVIPAIESIDVELNEMRAEVNLIVRQNGTDYSNRVISEGTLRVIALACIALNPYPIGLVGYEEPENGVQPSRLESLAAIIEYMAVRRGTQVLVNTHSPLFVSQALRIREKHPEQVAVYSVRMAAGDTAITRIEDLLPLFEDPTIETLLRNDEDAKVLALLQRGLLDG